MMIRVVEAEARKKEPTKKIEVPDWKAIVAASVDEKAIGMAVTKANQLDGSIVDPNSVRSLFPVLPRSLTAADIDFGRADVVTIKIADLIASQNWVKRDRLVWHCEHPGDRNDDQSPFVSMPIVAAENVIVDGHHALSACFLLGIKKVPAWSIPIGLATGHPR